MTTRNSMMKSLALRLLNISCLFIANLGSLPSQPAEGFNQIISLFEKKKICDVVIPQTQVISPPLTCWLGLDVQGSTSNPCCLLQRGFPKTGGFQDWNRDNLN